MILARAIAAVALAGLAAGPVRSAPGVADASSFHAADPVLTRLIERMLLENPAIAAARTRAVAAAERIDQARSLPDPTVTYRFFAQSPETRVGPQEHALELGQAVPWFGKRRLQAGSAGSEAEGQAWLAEAVARRAVVDLKRAYFEAAYIQESIRTVDEERELLRGFESIALKRYSTGQGIQQSVVKVQTEISRLEERRTRLEARLGIAGRQIAEIVGRPGDPMELPPIELSLPDLAIEPDRLEARALEGQPQLRAIESRIEAERIRADRRELDSRPDFRFGLGYTAVGDREDAAGRLNPPEDNGQDVLALTVGVNVPLYRKRIRAGVAEARAVERATRESLDAERNRLRRDVQEAVLRLQSLEERAALFRDVIVPQAEESLGSAQAAYSKDRLGFLDLLDAERVLFESRLGYHRIVSDLWIACAELELAIASPFPATSSPEASSGLSP